jgi:hypothetical protein
MKALVPLIKKTAPLIVILFLFTLMVVALDLHSPHRNRHHSHHYRPDSLKRLVCLEKNLYDSIPSSNTFVYSPMVTYHHGNARLIGTPIPVALPFNDRAPPQSSYI